MNWHETIQQLSEIPKGNYTGYIWLSDRKEPELVEEVDHFAYEKEAVPLNPFIREGYLYDGNKDISVSIHHVPGRYLIHVFNLGKIPKESEGTEQSFLSSVGFSGKIYFKEIWVPEKDFYCSNLEVLTKKAVVFIGFGEEKSNEY